MKRKNQGVITRPVPDWSVDRMSAVVFNSPAVAAQLSYVRLFNNATDGSSLWCYGLSYLTAANVGLEIELNTNILGTLAATEQPAPILQRAGGLPGQLFYFSNATCVAPLIGYISQNNNCFMWPYQWPFAVIPPLYSLYLHCDAVNTRTLGTIWYAALKG